MAAAIRVAVQREPFDLAAESAALRDGRNDVGAIVTFTGICRDEGGTLEALELEHYPGMAENELTRIAEEAAAKWPIVAATVIHRFGRIQPGEDIVLVVTASPHRAAALEAASFVMDFLKTRAPFWKKEHLRSGGKSWVAAKDSDDEAAERWT